MTVREIARNYGCEAAIGFTEPVRALALALTYAESRADIHHITKHFLRAYTEHATRTLRTEVRQLREERA